MDKSEDSSWEAAEKWYDQSVGEKGHYYHEKVVLPNVVRLLDVRASKNPKLLDLACGQGILARRLSKVDYTGVDISSSLIGAAKRYGVKDHQQFIAADVTKPLSINKDAYTHATIILALQNIAEPLAVLKNAYLHLQKGGRLLIVLNHPCFRIPRQSSWGIDEPKKLQYRRVDRYFSFLNIPIQTHPGKKGDDTKTWTFHHPLSSYTKWLKEAGFVIEQMEEWCSDKTSYGKTARMENFSRKEFPLFLTICALKP